MSDQQSGKRVEIPEDMHALFKVVDGLLSAAEDRANTILAGPSVAMAAVMHSIGILAGGEPKALGPCKSEYCSRVVFDCATYSVTETAEDLLYYCSDHRWKGDVDEVGRPIARDTDDDTPF